MDIERISLPGIGTCRTFTSATGRRVGVITHHASSRRDLIHSSSDDPDASCSLALNRDEAIALAGLLGIFDIVNTDGTGDQNPAAGAPAR
ncbi:potassium transporter TrkA [Dactylosporangium sp. CA-152071]|uniref:potassium transporter TrkA n=1 Tax=Dactylosporangium sp. CA-152071 TaxID=3239933 RepID=UPI003D903CB5